MGRIGRHQYLCQRHHQRLRDARTTLGRTRRALSFALYLGALVIGALILPLLVIARDWIMSATPHQVRSALGPAGRYDWPILFIVCIALLVTLYYLAVPVRARWSRDLPGAIAAMLLWLASSLLLRFFLPAAIADNPAYAVLAASVAALLFLNVTALAVVGGRGVMRGLREGLWLLVADVLTAGRLERDLVPIWCVLARGWQEPEDTGGERLPRLRRRHDPRRDATGPQ